MNTQDYFQIFKYFLFFFSILTFFASAYLFFKPEIYWEITKQSLKFKGITGAKVSKRFYWWVKTSALVQMLLAVIIFIVFWVLNSRV